MTDVRRLGSRVSAVAAVAALSLGVSGCAETAGPETGAAVEEIAQFPRDFVGDQVTVSAEVLEDAPENAFWLGADELGGNAILVFNTTGTEVSEGRVVQVTGTVRALDLTEFEDEEIIDAEADVFEPFVDTPVIVAEQIDAFVPAENST